VKKGLIKSGLIISAAVLAACAESKTLNGATALHVAAEQNGGFTTSSHGSAKHMLPVGITTDSVQRGRTTSSHFSEPQKMRVDSRRTKKGILTAWFSTGSVPQAQQDEIVTELAEQCFANLEGEIKCPEEALTDAASKLDISDERQLIPESRAAQRTNEQSQEGEPSAAEVNKSDDAGEQVAPAAAADTSAAAHAWTAVETAESAEPPQISKLADVKSQQDNIHRKPAWSAAQSSVSPDALARDVEAPFTPMSIEYEKGRLQRERPESRKALIGVFDPVNDLFGDHLNAVAPTFPAALDFSGQRLSFAELVRFVTARSYDVRIAQAREESAEAAIDLAKSASWPTLSLDVVNSHKHTAHMDGALAKDKLKTRVELVADYILYDFGSIDMDIRRTEKAFDQARFARLAREERVIEEVAKATLTILQADSTLQVFNDHMDRLIELENLIKVLVEGGGGTAADAQRVASRIDATRSSKIELEADREAAAAKFEKVTGVPFSYVIAPHIGSFYALSSPEDPITLDSHPEIVSLGYQIKALENQYRSQRRGHWPQVSMSGLTAWESSRTVNVDEKVIAELSMTVSQKLTDGGENDANRRQTIAALREVELKRMKLLDDLTEQARNVETFRSTDDNKSQILMSQIGSLQEIMRLYTSQFRVGQRTILELLESEADLLDAQVEQVSHDYDRARARISEAKLRGTLGQALASF
jgi:adhesin transport system outer membrane protein